MKFSLRVLSIIALVGLPGCSTQAPFERPVVDVPVQWSPRASALNTDASWPSSNWWKAFNDPTLDALVDRMREGNRDLKAAQARIGQARAGLQAAGHQLHFSAGFTTEQTRSRGLGSTGRIERMHSLKIIPDYEADLWDKFGSLVRSADATVSASEESERAVRLTLTADTVLAYFQLAALEERVVLAEGAIRNAERIDGIIETRYGAGAVSGLDRAQSRTSLSTLRAGRPPLVRAREEVRNALTLLAGTAPGSPIVNAAPRSVLAAALPTALPAGVPSQILERRPDIRQAEALLRAAHANVGVARANLYPTLALTGEGGFASSTLRNLLRGPSALLGFVGGLVGPIFEQDRLGALVTQADQRRVELVHLYHQTIFGALRDVENALIAIEQLGALETEQRELVQHAERTLELAETRYQSGLTDAITLLTAQSTLAAARGGLVDTRLARLGAQVSLYRGLGGGL
jgi:outer membrane protein, multidrug efflux system